ncbi:MAG: tetratricopeptide repeat protein [Treponema sp.]|jgi:tetratricopeptide (TPR) repeat protein|nr:tetratricopeptide repeat protein [Treponema sp.]
MPSLSALGEFRDSFNNIANEKADVASRDLPFDNLDLPDTEPPPFDPRISAAAPAPSDDSTDAASGVDTGGVDFDFNAFLNTVPGGDVPEPSVDDILADVSQPSGDVPTDDIFADVSQPSGDVPTDDIFADIGEPSGDIPKDDILADTGQPSGDVPTDDILADTGEPSVDTQTGDIPSFDDLMSGMTPDEVPSENAPAEASAEAPAEASAETPVETEADDFSVPKGLLNGLSDEIEAAPADFQEEPPVETDDNGSGIENFDPLNFGGLSPAEDTNGDGLGGDSSEALPDFNLDEPEDDQDEPIDNALDLGGEKRDGTLSAGTEDTPIPDDISTPDLESPIDSGGESAGDSGVEDLDFSGADLGEAPGSGADAQNGTHTIDDVLPDIDFSGVGTEPEADTSAALDDSSFPSADSSDAGAIPGLDDFALPGADSSAPDQTLPDFGADNLDVDSSPNAGADDSGALPSFDDLGGDFSSDSIELETAGADAGTGTDSGGSDEIDFDGDDFHIPGLDDIFDKDKKETAAQPVKKKGFFGRRKEEVEEEPDSDEVEEVRLSQEELEKLMATLSSYPLNLRIACEEIIAEQVIAPQQLSKIIRYLIRNAPPKDAAELAGEILGKTIIIPKSFEKSTGAAWEAEKASFSYIFVHNFLPVLRLFAFIAAMLFSIGYLGYKFIYIPIKAESLYKRGYERIFAGEYQRAEELFHQAFQDHRKKKWFYAYAQGFRDQRRYMLAEEKYDELLRYYPRDKRGVLEYANLETYYLLNYDKANRLLQQQLLDYAPNDYDGLLAAGDNFMAWADSDPSKFYDKYEDARFSYARIMEKNGWQVPIVERMLMYFIRTDDLKEVINLRSWFESSRSRKLSPETIAELGGYLLDKQLAAASGEVKGVPNPYVESIESVRAMLLQAVMEKPELPEPHYHLARYYKNLGNIYEERLTLENAIRAFDLAQSESVRRRLYRVDTHYRYANMLINNKEFFPAEEQIVRGIELFEDFLSRNLIPPSAQLGQLYAAKGDLEYFVKAGDMRAALTNYRQAERYGYTPPEIQYRMGAAYYYIEDWRNALDYLFKASTDLPLNRRLLFALGNTAYKRGDYYAAQGYYDRLLNIMDGQRVRLPVLLPNEGTQFLELGERLMMANNNAGVVYEALAEQTGNRQYRTRALGLYAESARAWDAITRNPATMARMRLVDSPGAPGVNLGFLNASNAMRPVPGFNPEIFLRIDKDVLEPSKWEDLAPYGGLVN